MRGSWNRKMLPCAAADSLGSTTSVRAAPRSAGGRSPARAAAATSAPSRSPRSMAASRSVSRCTGEVCRGRVIGPVVDFRPRRGIGGAEPEHPATGDLAPSRLDERQEGRSGQELERRVQDERVGRLGLRSADHAGDRVGQLGIGECRERCGRGGITEVVGGELDDRSSDVGRCREEHGGHDRTSTNVEVKRSLGQSVGRPGGSVGRVSRPGAVRWPRPCGAGRPSCPAGGRS